MVTMPCGNGVINFTELTAALSVMPRWETQNKLTANKPTDLASLFNLNANLENWKTNTV